jgi:predicted Zn-dependent peptidase
MAKGTKYQKTVFPNGLRVISESIPAVRSISIGVWIDVGSRDEPVHLEGVSHFIEHMVFKGTATRSPQQIAAHLESVGGILNAFTSREQTCYYAKIIDQHLPLAIEVIADLVFNGRFDEADMQKEKNIIIDEINEVNDTPSDLVHDFFAETIFGEHSLGRPIMGSAKSVKGLSRPNVLSYLTTSYQPKKMIVAASGNLKHQALVNLVKKYFGEHPLNNQKPLRRIKPELRPGAAVMRRKTSQTHICIGTPAYRLDHPQRAALMLLNSIIGGGMSSRLFQKIREEMGMAYTVFSYLDFFMDAGIIGVYLNADKKNANVVISTVIKELYNFTSQNLDSKEIDSAKEQLKGSLVLGLENTSNRMNRMAKHELLLQRYITVDETISEIEKITATKVKDIASRLFVRDKFAVAVLGPISKQTVTNAIP